MTPEVSVLLPYRDAAATIGEALDSILGQRAVTFEVVAVDDGSRDAGPAAVARAAAAGAPVVALATPGLGIARALELARAHARAPLLARMDADDVARPERLLLQVEALHREPGLAVVGARVRVASDLPVGAGMQRYVAWQNSLLSPADHARQLFVESPLCHPSVMLRAAALTAVGGFRDGPFAEDYDLWLRLDAQGFAMAKVPEVLLEWRHHSQRLTFSDARYAPEALLAVKAPHLARRVAASGRPVVVWGAGPTGKRVARALERYGVRTSGFIDVDPRKIGGRARGVGVASPQALVRGAATVIAAVGAAGARDEIRAFLDERGFAEGDDYLCAA